MVQILHSIASFIRTGKLLQDPDNLLLLLSIAIYLSDDLLSYTGLATSLIGATTPPPFLVYFLTSALALPCCWGQSSRHHPRPPQQERNLYCGETPHLCLNAPSYLYLLCTPANNCLHRTDRWALLL